MLLENQRCFRSWASVLPAASVALASQPGGALMFAETGWCRGRVVNLVSVVQWLAVVQPADAVCLWNFYHSPFTW